LGHPKTAIQRAQIELTAVHTNSGTLKDESDWKGWKDTVVSHGSKTSKTSTSAVGPTLAHMIPNGFFDISKTIQKNVSSKQTRALERPPQARNTIYGKSQ
jgi:hypothetical protein